MSKSEVYEVRIKVVERKFGGKEEKNLRVSD